MQKKLEKERKEREKKEREKAEKERKALEKQQRKRQGQQMASATSLSTDRVAYAGDERSDGSPALTGSKSESYLNAATTADNKSKTKSKKADNANELAMQQVPKGEYLSK